MDSNFPGYRHTQKAPLCLFLYGMAFVLLVAAWAAQANQTACIALTASGIIAALTAPAFHHLTVEDAGDVLLVRFGPLPVPLLRLQVPYDEILSVEVGETLLVEGLGIHRSPRGGWVWNIGGRDCVVVQRRNGVLRIGTDDADNLCRFLQAKTAKKGAW